MSTEKGGKAAPGTLALQAGSGMKDGDPLQVGRDLPRGNWRGTFKAVWRAGSGRTINLCI